ncbi:hypothetical protein L596_028194 [Steinernema carpocapsae]|uniref:KA1 domain-containing protein n=1 Tax=Steinernema carpocapsae TaxID=34508 RepID=A0A4U5LXQ2_STECR|nr:hypothetical protein L596_028194 [Steinernema carpocapsae]
MVRQLQAINRDCITSSDKENGDTKEKPFDAAAKRRCVPTHHSSQPVSRSESEDLDSFESAARAMKGFSQPADIGEILLSSSQSQNHLDNLELLVRRMTRFCVSVPLERALESIESSVGSLGFSCFKKINNQIEVRGGNGIKFVVTIHSTNEKVMIDCRRSQGDGLEFKRVFLNLRKSLAPIICKTSTLWLETQGLKAKNKA